MIKNVSSFWNEKRQWKKFSLRPQCGLLNFRKCKYRKLRWAINPIIDNFDKALYDIIIHHTIIESWHILFIYHFLFSIACNIIQYHQHYNQIFEVPTWSDARCIMQSKWKQKRSPFISAVCPSKPILLSHRKFSYSLYNIEVFSPVGRSAAYQFFSCPLFSNSCSYSVSCSS